MNFNAIYNAALSKVAREADEIKSKKGFSILENKILKNPSLTKQYIVYSTIKEAKRGMSSEEAQNLVLFVERYCSKLNYADLDKANREFAKYLNLNIKTLKSSPLDEAIDSLLRFTTGGTVILTEGTKYRATLLDFLTTTSQDVVIENKAHPLLQIAKPADLLEVATISLNKTYNALSESEKEIVEAIRSRNPAKIEPKLRIIESLAKRVSIKEKSEMLLKCVAELRTRLKVESVENVIYKVYDLHKAAVGILEGQFGGGYQKKLKDLTYIKNIQFGCFDDRDKPESVILRFTIYMYPLAATYMDYNRAAKDLDKRLSRINRNVANQTIFQSTGIAKQFFTGEGIWDSSVRSEGLKPGQKTPGNVEWWLYTIQDNDNPKSIKAFEPAGYEILKQLDAIIAKWIPEVDPKVQQSYLAMLKEPIQKNEPQGDDSDESDSWYAVDEPEIGGEVEPTVADITAVERGFAADDDDDDDY